LNLNILTEREIVSGYLKSITNLKVSFEGKSVAFQDTILSGNFTVLALFVTLISNIEDQGTLLILDGMMTFSENLISTSPRLDIDLMIA
jgi:hypothetical protein